jgi:hypothetical protein
MEETDDVKIGDIKNLDPFVNDAEATEIIATDVIDYLPLNDMNTIIDHWVSKLRRGGKIVIGGIDLFQVCKAFTQYDINVETANKLLHGLQDQPHLLKRLTLTLTGLRNYLRDKHGLKILKTRYAGYSMIVEAQRPTVGEINE